MERIGMFSVVGSGASLHGWGQKSPAQIKGQILTKRSFGGTHDFWCGPYIWQNIEEQYFTRFLVRYR
jgi:hypothetical protein